MPRNNTDDRSIESDSLVKELSAYKKFIKASSPSEVFSYLAATLNESITFWDYFVNWQKVLGNLSDLEIDLNTLNYLVGKENIEDEFKTLLQRQNSLARIVPLLLACRETEFSILTDFASGNLKYENFSFQVRTALSNDDIEKACRFAKETGLLELFRSRRLRSVPDYVLGVEVGLDSNGRKNRSGASMEDVIEGLLIPICDRHNLSVMKQATSDKVKEQWNLQLKVDKSSRRFDFAVKRAKTLFLIETNYYSGGGSKLKATAGEYRSLNDFIVGQGHTFIWITDGQGWKSTLRPLQETFDLIDFTLNIRMILDGILEHVLAYES